MLGIKAVPRVRCSPHQPAPAPTILKLLQCFLQPMMGPTPTPLPKLALLPGLPHPVPLSLIIFAVSPVGLS